MLHWNSWWVQASDAVPKAGAQPPQLPSDPGAWSPEGWLAWQFNLWNQSLEASLAWWRLYGVTVPTMPWLQAASVPASSAGDEAPATPLALLPSTTEEKPARVKAIASQREGAAAVGRVATRRIAR